MRRLRRHAGYRVRRSAGFTILELLVAISLLAVLAVLSWRGLEGVLTTREVIVSRSDALRELTTVMAQLDDDLRRSWPLRLLDLQSIGFDVGDDRSPPTLRLLREATEGGASQILRVIWRLRDGVLERGFAPQPQGFSGGVGEAESQPFWQAVSAGVQSFELRGWVEGRGWVPATTLAIDLARQAAEEAAQAEQMRKQAQAQRAATPPGGAGSPSGGIGAPQGGIVPVATMTPQIVVRAIEMTLSVRDERLVRIFALAD